MKLTYCYVLIQSMIQSGIYTHGFHIASVDTWTGHKSSIPRLQKIFDFEAKSRHGGDKIDWDMFSTHINPSTEFNQSQSDEFINFWKKEKRSNARMFQTEAICYMNELILSEQETWEEKITRIFENIKLGVLYTSLSEQIAFFQILWQLLALKNVPFKILQIIHHELIKMEEMTTDLIDVFPDKYAKWRDPLLKTIDMSEQRYKECIEEVEHGKDLIDFVTIQKGLGKYGIKLAGDWSPKDQKPLFKLWISDRMKFYVAVKENPPLQLVLETQFMQTELIEVLKAINPIDLEVKKAFVAWCCLTLREQLDTVMDYLNSLDEDRQALFSL
ncbi:uncharacterized protein MELLADRAFT_61632 [Melampsora larici-populina 98AG31]|uniref:Uncharacterized protein n=1 Tax=Melampsora larici-populina (strain 98AG31 / pathotype 3-4-7) TaxID=747676 RepID=F4RFP5_MELLP|nr:uncharacterized protein MELLADRAFT_61632 [Melampsora larici-populina 98AG31]EGG08847.1 hypothetical protein MELLADRAFT_61632 [Melampsora larici-populina 98AG31]